MLEIGADHISLPTRTAIPLGFIVNEIATNAVKHGFTDNEEPRFKIDLTTDKADNCTVVTLANTGKPFPEDIDLDNPETLGLQLITALVDQLHGTLELQRKPHPVFTITFPCSQ